MGIHRIRKLELVKSFYFLCPLIWGLLCMFQIQNIVDIFTCDLSNVLSRNLWSVKISLEQARALRKCDFSAGIFVAVYWFIYSYFILGLLIDDISNHKQTISFIMERSSSMKPLNFKDFCIEDRYKTKYKLGNSWNMSFYS